MTVPQLNASRVMIDVIPATGGLDVVTPPVSVVPGSLLAAENFVCSEVGGYTRIKGYERFDGSLSPSDATYVTVTLSTPAVASLNDTFVLGAKTYTVLGARGTELYVYGNDVAAFSHGTNFTLNDVTYTVVDALLVGAEDAELHARLQSLAANHRRASISPPSGSGAVLSVLGAPNDTVLAFRADSSGVVKAFKSSPSGWVDVPLAMQLPIKNATVEIKVDDVIVGASSGASAKVVDVILTSGSFSTATPGVGILVLDNVSGTFAVDENLSRSGTTVAKASAANARVVIPASTSMVGVVYNFGSAEALYFVDRISLTIYRYDGTRIVGVPVTTTKNTPLVCIFAHKHRLYVSAAASLFISAPGKPFTLDAVEGAAEIGVGATITNVVAGGAPAETSAIVITTTHSLHILYGNSETDWQLQTLSTDIGALRDTAAAVNGDVLFASESGLYTIETVQQFGNFSVNSVSQLIAPLYKEVHSLIRQAVVRADSSQYRLFCSDGRVLVATQVRTVSNSGSVIKSLMFSVVSYKDFETESFVYNNVCRIVSSSGGERFFLSGGSFVYEIDRGTSFDGRPIFAYFITAFFMRRTFMLRKRYKRLFLSVLADSYATCSVQYDVSPSAYDGGTSRSLIVNMYPRGTWFDAASWGSFVWSAGVTPEFRLDTPAAGKAMSVLVKSLSDMSDAFTVQAFTVQYTVGRMER
jgi:hypothetical protein